MQKTAICKGMAHIVYRCLHRFETDPSGDRTHSIAVLALGARAKRPKCKARISLSPHWNGGEN
jgi:hypothetical protein